MDTVAVLPLVILLAVVVAAVVWAFAQRRGQGPEDPACGSCGYLVRGLTTFTCPECGSDLREIGITTPDFRRTTGPFGRVVIWSLVLILPALLITQFVGSMLPRQYTSNRHVSLHRPHSGAFQVVTVRGTGTAYGQGQPILLDAFEVELKDLTGNVTWMQLTPSEAAGMTHEKLLAWMRSSGVDTEREKIDAEVAELLRVVNEASTGTLPKISGSFTSSGGGGGGGSLPGWFAPTAICFWMVVWSTGVRLILRRHARSARAADLTLENA